MVDLREEEFHLFKNYLQEVCGIHIPSDKSYLFQTRLQSLLIEEKIKDFSELYFLLKKDSAESLRRQLIESMTTNETSFFRDKLPFDALNEVILSGMAKRKRSQALFFEPKIRIWSAGCSTGQEPYSIAILLDKWMKKDGEWKWNNFDILATDISNRVLEKARRGFYYEKEALNGLSREDLDIYFQKTTDGFTVKEEIKKAVRFQELNLATYFENDLGKLDIIFCRNVLIYFSRPVIEKIFSQFFNLLNPEGVLILGSSESLYNIPFKLKAESFGKSIFYIK